MPEAVRCLRRIFAHEICRGVAAITGRNRAVRRLEPAVELLLHDVAVGAGCRIVSEVGPTLGIGEGINTDVNSNADNHSKQDALEHALFHLCFRSPTIIVIWEAWNIRYSDGLNFLNHLNDLNLF